MKHFVEGNLGFPSEQDNLRSMAEYLSGRETDLRSKFLVVWEGINFFRRVIL